MKRRPDYQKKNFKNPLYPKRNKSVSAARGFNRRLAWFVIIVIVAGLFFLSNSSRFKITKIEINGNQLVDTQDIERLVNDQLAKRRWLFFHQSSIFFFNKSQTKSVLEQTYFLEELAVKKKYFNTVVINLKEKNSGLIWASNQKQYYLDLTGVAIREIQPTDLLFFEGLGDTEIIRAEINSGQYPLVKDQSNREVVIGQPAGPEALVDFVVALTKLLEPGADFSVSHYEVSSSNAQDITLVTQEGWLAKFSLTNPVESQFNSLMLILRQRVPDRAKLDYIDLRFGEKIFWQ